eukprot:EG_transcript_1763
MAVLPVLALVVALIPAARRWLSPPPPQAPLYVTLAAAGRRGRPKKTASVEESGLLSEAPVEGPDDGKDGGIGDGPPIHPDVWRADPKAEAKGGVAPEPAEVPAKGKGKRKAKKNEIEVEEDGGEDGTASDEDSFKSRYKPKVQGPKDQVTKKLEGKVFCFAGSFEISRMELDALMVMHGARITTEFNDTVTHVVASGKGLRSKKVELARQKGIPIVDESYIYEELKGEPAQLKLPTDFSFVSPPSARQRPPPGLAARPGGHSYGRDSADGGWDGRRPPPAQDSFQDVRMTRSPQELDFAGPDFQEKKFWDDMGIQGPRDDGSEWGARDRSRRSGDRQFRDGGRDFGASRSGGREFYGSDHGDRGASSWVPDGPPGGRRGWQDGPDQGGRGRWDAPAGNDDWPQDRFSPGWGDPAAGRFGGGKGKGKGDRRGWADDFRPQFGGKGQRFPDGKGRSRFGPGWPAEDDARDGGSRWSRAENPNSTRRWSNEVNFKVRDPDEGLPDFQGQRRADTSFSDRGTFDTATPVDLDDLDLSLLNALDEDSMMEFGGAAPAGRAMRPRGSFDKFNAVDPDEEPAWPGPSGDPATAARPADRPADLPGLRAPGRAPTQGPSLAGMEGWTAQDVLREFENLPEEDRPRPPGQEARMPAPAATPTLAKDDSPPDVKGVKSKVKAKGKARAAVKAAAGATSSGDDSEPEALTSLAEPKAKAKGKAKAAKGKVSDSEGGVDMQVMSESKPKARGRQAKVKDAATEGSAEFQVTAEAKPKAKGRAAKAKDAAGEVSAEGQVTAEAKPKAKGRAAKAKDAAGEVSAEGQATLEAKPRARGRSAKAKATADEGSAKGQVSALQ